MVKNPPAMPETQKIQVQFLGQEDPLGEEMTTHCSILAWRTPQIEEPGGLQSMGSPSWTQLNTQPLLKSLASNSMWAQKSLCAVPSVLSVHQFVLAQVCPLPYLDQGQNLPALGNTTDYFLILAAAHDLQLRVSVAACAKHSLRKTTPRDTALVPPSAREKAGSLYRHS